MFTAGASSLRWVGPQAEYLQTLKLHSKEYLAGMDLDATKLAQFHLTEPDFCRCHSVFVI